MDKINQLLTKGVTAIKANQKEEARQHLLKVIELDDQNERAWLWLSGAVETDEERRICLENVLTINPDNELARKGLSKIGGSKLENVALPRAVEARAAQLRAEEPEDDRGWWTETKVEPSPNAKELKFDDVWSRNDEICAFCATPIKGIKDKCPQCEKSLVTKTLVNLKPSLYHARLLKWTSILVGFRVIGLVFSLVAIMFLPEELGADLGSGERQTAMMTTIASIVFSIAAVWGIFKRETWAYWLMLLIALGNLAEVSIGFIVATDPYSFICLTPLLFLALYILFSIYMAGGDFKREKVRQVAMASRRLKDPVRLDKVAQQLAKKGMWATAVMYWQRAIGHASGHAPYLLRLGHGYAELGFYERSIDILKSAAEAAKKPDVRDAVEKELVRVNLLAQSPD